MPRIAYKSLNISAPRLELIETANTIIENYQNQGYILTLRQLYYQFVSRGLIENSERSYKNLGCIVSDGRDAGLLDWTGIEDRGRGIRPWLINEDEQDVLNGIEYQFALDKWARQNAYIEVWVEKEALSAVIERPCNRYAVPYMPCKGYLSASEAWRAGQRFQEQADMGRRCAVIHLGDHDPSGIDMSRDNLDRLRLYSQGSDLELRRIALNMDQVEQYSPPPNPAKVTDSRAVEYIRRFGHTSWELDALEPKVLDDLIAAEIRTFIDDDVWQETKEEQDRRRETLSKLHENWDEVSEFVSTL